MGMENIAAVANFGTGDTNKVSLELKDMKVLRSKDFTSQWFAHRSSENPLTIFIRNHTTLGASVILSGQTYDRPLVYYQNSKHSCKNSSIFATSRNRKSSSW